VRQNAIIKCSERLNGKIGAGRGNTKELTEKEVKQAAKFCVDHDDFSSLPTRPILALIRVKDDNVRDKAISLVENVLKSKTPTGDSSIVEQVFVNSLFVDCRTPVSRHVYIMVGHITLLSKWDRK
jgi:hypothetical protein